MTNIYLVIKPDDRDDWTWILTTKDKISYWRSRGKVDDYFSTKSEAKARVKELNKEDKPKPKPEPEPDPKPDPKPEPEPPTVPEEYADYWMNKGYAFGEAVTIALWCRENKMTPTEETIKKEIIPYSFKVPESMQPLAKSYDISSDKIVTAIKEMPQPERTPTGLEEAFRYAGLDDWADKYEEVHTWIVDTFGVPVPQLDGSKKNMVIVSHLGVGAALKPLASRLSLTGVKGSLAKAAGVIMTFFGVKTGIETVAKVFGYGLWAQGVAMFGEFIFEEAVQAAGMAVFIARGTNDPDTIEDALSRYRVTVEAAQSMHKTVGRVDVIGYGAFTSFFDAAKKSIKSYEALILKLRADKEKSKLSRSQIEEYYKKKIITLTKAKDLLKEKEYLIPDIELMIYNWDSELKGLKEKADKKQIKEQEKEEARAKKEKESKEEADKKQIKEQEKEEAREKEKQEKEEAREKEKQEKEEEDRYKDLTKSEIERLKKGGLITDGDYLVYMTTIGYKENESRLFLELLKSKMETKAQELKESQWARAYKDGMISRDQYKEQLRLLRYDPLSAEMLAKIRESEIPIPEDKIRELTKTEILRIYKLGNINEDEARKRLKKLKYVSKDIDLLIKSVISVAEKNEE